MSLQDQPNAASAPRDMRNADVPVITPIQMMQPAQQGAPAYVTAPWPQHTTIMHGMVDGKLVFQGDGTGAPKDVITISPANGQAQYRIISDDGETMTLELIPGATYTPLQDTQQTQQAAAPDIETLIRHTIMAEAFMLKPEFARSKGFPPVDGGSFDMDSIALSDLPGDVLDELAARFEDPRDADLYSVVKREIDRRAQPEVIRTVNDQGRHIA